jgi:hypothetical protein
VQNSRDYFAKCSQLDTTRYLADRLRADLANKRVILTGARQADTTLLARQLA